MARPGYLDNAVKLGVLDHYATLEDLAKGANLPLDALKASIAEVNDSIASGMDKAWGRYIDKEFVPLENGPWYIAELSPKVHHCMGGIQTTPEGQAIDIVTGKPIDGFWAAGEASAGTHGAVRLGCNAILDCLVGGRAAGQGIVKA